MIIILMGVSGSGKTTIGKLLAEGLDWQFYDGDEFHPQSNINKMKQGIALTDDDREPWLNALRKFITELTNRNEPAVIACSALRRSFREYLLRDNEGVYFVYLKGSYDLIKNRLDERQDHFMKADLLASQFDALEEPEGMLAVDISQEPGVVVSSIKKELEL